MSAPSIERPAAAAGDAPSEAIVRVEEVNWLIERLGMKHGKPLNSLAQCSSSFFVILFQNTFDYELQDLEVHLDTQEKKVRNVAKVIDALEHVFGRSFDYISPEKIVEKDPVHISRLINVFLDVVAHIDDNVDERGSASDSHPPSRRAQISNWVSHVELPPHAAPVNGNREAGHHHIGVVRGRMHAVEHAAARPVPREEHADLAAAFSAADEVFSRRVLPPRATALFTKRRADKQARDAKIEALRAERFLEELQAAVVSAVQSDHNRREVDLKRRLDAELKRQIRDFREQKRQAKEEDRRFREIYRDAVESARNDRVEASRVDREVAKQVIHVRRSELLQQRLAERAVQRQRKALDTEYQRFSAALGSWRSRNFIF